MTTPRFVEYNIYIFYHKTFSTSFGTVSNLGQRIQNVPDKESKHNVYMNQVGHFILYTYI